MTATDTGPRLALVALFGGVASGVFLKGIGSVPPSEAIAIRSALAFCVLALALACRRRPSGPLGAPGAARAALDAVAGLCFALAVFEMPLGLLASIHATLPVVSTILSAALLGERMRPVAWVASILALCGTLLILKPGFGPSPLGVWLAVCSTLAYASRDIVTRRLPAGTDTLKIVLASLSLIGAASALLPDDIPWRVPTPGDAGRLAGAAASFITANLLIVAAFRRSPISTIAPLRYTSILWALAFDAVLWGIVPDATGWAGTCLIVASGLVILRRHS